MTNSPTTAAADADVWFADFEELYAVEQDVLMRELGISRAEELGTRMTAVLALTAVLIRRRTLPEIPLERWKTLRMKDLTLPKAPEEGEADPTSPA